MSEKQRELDVWSSIVFVMIMATPLLNTVPFTYHPTYFKLMVQETAVLVVWALIAIWAFAGRERPWLDRLFLVAAGYGAWGLATVLWAHRRWPVAEPEVQRVFYLALGVGLAYLLSQRQRREFFVLGYLTVAAIAALLMIVNWGPPISLPAVDVGFGGKELFFGNPDVACGFLLLPMMLAMAIISSIKDPSESYGEVLLGLGCVVLGFIAILRASTIAGVIALVAGTLVVNAAFYYFWRKALKWLAGAGVVAALLLLLLQPTVLKQGTVYPRLLTWEATAKALVSPRVIYGYGLGNFLLVHREHQLPEYFAQPHNAPVSLYAHNMPLHVTLEEGLIGFGILALFLLLLVTRAWRGATSATGEYDRAIGAGVAAGVVAMVVHSLFGVAWFSIGAAENLWIALGLVCGAFGEGVADQQPAGSGPRLWRPALATGGILLALCVVWVFGALPAMRTEIDLHKAAARMKENEPDDLRQPPPLPTIRENLIYALNDLYRAQLAGYESVAMLTVRVKAIAAFTQLELAETLLSRFTREVPNPESRWLRSGLVLCDQIDALAPNYGETNLLRSRLEMALGRPDRAFIAYRSFCSKNPYSFEAHKTWTEGLMSFFDARTAATWSSAWNLPAFPLPQEERVLFFRLTAEAMKPWVDRSADPQLHYVLSNSYLLALDRAAAERYRASTETLAEQVLSREHRTSSAYLKALLAHGWALKEKDAVRSAKDFETVLQLTPRDDPEYNALLATSKAVAADILDRTVRVWVRELARYSRQISQPDFVHPLALLRVPAAQSRAILLTRTAAEKARPWVSRSSDPEFHSALSAAYRQIADREAAELFRDSTAKAAANVLAKRPNDLGTLLLHAWAVMEKDPEVARTDLETVLKLDPANVRAKSLLARLARQPETR